MFSEDTMIFPKETAHFGFYNENGDVISLNQTDLYNSDYIGLRELTEKNKTQFLTFEGNHLQFSREQIDEFIVPVLV